MSNEYILIVGREANFSSRVMFIPKAKFLACEKGAAAYQILTQHSYRRDLKDGRAIENILTVKMCLVTIDGKNRGHQQEETPYTQIVNYLINLASGPYIVPSGHNDWYPDAIIVYGMGFDDVANYFKYRDLTEIVDNHGIRQDIQVVDSFLFTEQFDDDDTDDYDVTDINKY